MIRIPSSCALVNLLPALSPAITMSVFFETLPVILAPGFQLLRTLITTHGGKRSGEDDRFAKERIIFASHHDWRFLRNGVHTCSEHPLNTGYHYRVTEERMNALSYDAAYIWKVISSSVVASMMRERLR